MSIIFCQWEAGLCFLIATLVYDFLEIFGKETVLSVTWNAIDSRLLKKGWKFSCMEIFVNLIDCRSRRDLHLLLHLSLEQVLEHNHYSLRNNLCAMCIHFVRNVCVFLLNASFAASSSLKPWPMATSTPHSCIGLHIFLSARENITWTRASCPLEKVVLLFGESSVAFACSTPAA